MSRTRILLARAETFARSAGSKIAKVFKNPNTQDSVVISSSELGAAVGKKVLEGGGRKNTPPSPSPSPYLIPNPDFVVEKPRVHHTRPLFTCCFPISASHTSNYSDDLQPHFPEEVSRGEGGDFLSWKRNGNEIGASMIVLHPNALAQPFFSDHSKVAIVSEGSGTAGLLLVNHNLGEKVVHIFSGDVIPLPPGTVTWWFNSSNTKLTVVFLGQQHFTDFCLAGPKGVLGGFSSEVLSAFLELDEAAVATFLSSQTTEGRIVRAKFHRFGRGKFFDEPFVSGCGSGGI